jgi:hypothetical protein
MIAETVDNASATGADIPSVKIIILQIFLKITTGESLENSQKPLLRFLNNRLYQEW